MASILELLRERQQARQAMSPAAQGVRSGIVIRATSPTYLVNDGFSQVSCYSLAPGHLRPGDRVWVAQGSGVSLILGLAGRDPNFVED